MHLKWELNNNHLAQNLMFFYQALTTLLSLSFPTTQVCYIQYLFLMSGW